MAKKRGKPQPRKNGKRRVSSFISSVKKMFLGAFAVVVCFIGVLFIYNWFFPVAKERPVAKKQDRAEAAIHPKSAVKGDSGDRRRKPDKRRSLERGCRLYFPGRSRGPEAEEQAERADHKTRGLYGLV